MKQLALALLVSFPLAAAAGEAKEPDWAVDGQWIDTCSCKAPCPCWDMEKPTQPTEHHCSEMFFFHVDKGHYGATKLDGMNVVQVAVSGDNKPWVESMEKQDFPLTWLYLDKSATDDQVKAAEAIFNRLAFATGLMAKKKGTSKVAMKVQQSPEMLTVEIPKILDAKVKSTGKPFKYDTSAEGWLGKSTQGVSMAFNYKDQGHEWKYKDRNGLFSHFAWSSAKGPLPWEQPPPAAAPAKNAPAKK